MSKQHSNLLQMFNNKVAGYDRIWSVAQNVWKGITSAMVSRALLRASLPHYAENYRRGWKQCLAVPWNATLLGKA